MSRDLAAAAHGFTRQGRPSQPARYPHHITMGGTDVAQGQDALHHRRLARHRARHRASSAARDGANVAIAAKTAEPHPKLPGTIYTRGGGDRGGRRQGLPLLVDIRDERAGRRARSTKTAETFGGIDILVNNASAIQPDRHAADRHEALRSDAPDQHARHLHGRRNTRIPHLKKAANPHILTLSPPLDMRPRWFAPHLAYSMAKYGMSLCVLGLAGELAPKDGIAVNALWPRTTIATAAVQEPARRRQGDAGSRARRRSWPTRAHAISQQALARVHRPVPDRRRASWRARASPISSSYRVDPSVPLMPTSSCPADSKPPQGVKGGLTFSSSSEAIRKPRSTPLRIASHPRSSQCRRSGIRPAGLEFLQQPVRRAEIYAACF